MKNLNNQFKSPTTKKYEAALDSLSDLKCGSDEYTAKQQEIETFLRTIEREATRAAQGFREIPGALGGCPECGVAYSFVFGVQIHATDCASA